ncbi:uncharacterized protein B0H18DRAFT_1115301 [Fomitopsis serialis]|uniref:uncharacterized protein n=1 Tax=Fomitopsis serialis TaxID=139415 RepID=UPI002008A8CC|nr:uncharacterized protein B0H18DRAFT_1115301 [Neoantrodia serialis]KAH9933286.1 hypothetical protein B0H18DRAFT_1115301 [Neoantrodia serialis]
MHHSTSRSRCSEAFHGVPKVLVSRCLRTHKLGQASSSCAERVTDLEEDFAAFRDEVFDNSMAIKHLLCRTNESVKNQRRSSESSASLCADRVTSLQSKVVSLRLEVNVLTSRQATDRAIVDNLLGDIATLHESNQKFERRLCSLSDSVDRLQLENSHLEGMLSSYTSGQSSPRCCPATVSLNTHSLDMELKAADALPKTQGWISLVAVRMFYLSTLLVWLNFQEYIFDLAYTTTDALPRAQGWISLVVQSYIDATLRCTAPLMLELSIFLVSFLITRSFSIAISYVMVPQQYEYPVWESLRM